jgi:2-keto-4-pentenoate hydratase/2-oxohepta-3-ene-1,7-dioic acid hydratase in catechol pathway
MLPSRAGRSQAGGQAEGNRGGFNIVRIVRYRSDSEILTGVLDGDTVRQARGDMFDRLAIGPVAGSLEDIEIVAPVVPGKLIAIGLNYRDHIEQDTQMEVPENPIIFLKPPSAIIGPDAPIILPDGPEKIDAEAELCIVIGKRCRNVKAADAASVILGYTCGNDVSARDYQYRDGQWVRAKGFDTFAPLGPAIVTDVDPSSLAVSSRVNGEQRQSSSTSYLLFDVPALVEFISGVMTLEPGDVIMTGTPAGPPKLSPGDVCEIEIEGLGVLRNPVEATS